MEKEVQEIKRQLSSSVRGDNRRLVNSSWTLRDFLAAIYQHQQEKSVESRTAVGREQHLGDSSLIAIGVMGLILVFGPGRGSVEFEFVERNAFSFLAFGVVLCVWFVLVSLERANLLSYLSKFTTVRLTVGFLFAAGTIFATAEANSVLNSVLGVDASNVPLSRAFLASTLFLKLMWPAFVLLGLLAVARLLGVFAYFKWRASDENGDSGCQEFPVISAIFVVVAVVVSVCYAWSMQRSFDTKYIPKKAYNLALFLDFNDSAYCVPGVSGYKVLFLGASQDRVLVAKSPVNDELSLKSFVTSEGGELDREYQSVQVKACSL